MGDMTLADIVKLADRGGFILALVLFAVAMVKGWLVPKWIYDLLQKDTVPRWAYEKLEKDCARATELATRTTQLLERYADVTERVVSAPAAGPIKGKTE